MATNGWPFPFPMREDIPAGLQGLISLIMRAQDQQKAYANTPLAQMFWPDARAQYVNQLAPGLYGGGGVRYNLGQQPDVRVGVGFGTRF
jgi:hypothetical protein